MKNGFIMMTALPPTRGHKQLVQFALDYLNFVNGIVGTPMLTLLVCTRDEEPIATWKRVDAFYTEFADYTTSGRLTVCSFHGEAPQNPKGEDDQEFWDFWKSTVKQYFLPGKEDIVFTSENYGIRLAKELECKFVPFDIKREIIDVSGTMVRKHPTFYFDQIMPSFQPYLRKTITIFGAESTGKTTMARSLAASANGYFVPEWARGYLETVGPELTDEKMETIIYGQHAAQNSSYLLRDKPYIFQDTDLLSTIGYYRITNRVVPDELISLFNLTMSDLYIVMNSSIPFEKDPLRYGGDVRESTDQFWIDLLEEFHCKYYVVKSTLPYDQFIEASFICGNQFNSQALFGFVRD